MEFVNRRLAETPLSTIGKLDDIGLDCDIFILEPGTHGAPHERVAAGVYPLELRQTLDGRRCPEGKYREFMAVRKLAGTIRPGLPHLVMNPDRLALIHPGNTYRDTEACSLPGLSCVQPNDSNSQEWEVAHSQDALLKIYPIILAAVRAGGATWHIVDVGG